MLGERLQAARKAAGFRSQQALADRLGVSRETVSRAEREDSPHVRSETLAAWARLCGVSIDALLAEDDTEPTVSTVATPATAQASSDEAAE